MILPLDGDERSGWKPGRPYALSNGSFREIEPAFSPDGRWLAYASDESGKPEVYVRPFAGEGATVQVSTAGGTQPVWSRNGKELVFLQDQRSIVSAAYSAANATFRPDKPRLAAALPGTPLVSPPGPVGHPRTFDLDPNGKRFAVLGPPPAAEMEKRNQIILITNFRAVLRRATGSRN